MIKITNFTMKYDFDCGPTAIAILLSAYGVNYKPDDLIKILKTTEEEGTSWRRMKTFLKNLKLFKIEEHESISKAKKYLDQTIPLLICWNVDGDPEFSHYSIIIGMTDTNVSILDPEDRDKFTKHELAEFKKDWQPYRYWSVRLISNKRKETKHKFGAAAKTAGAKSVQSRGVLNTSMVQGWKKSIL